MKFFFARIPYLVVLLILLASNIWSMAALWYDSDYEYKICFILGIAGICALSIFYLRPSFLKLFLHSLVFCAVYYWWSQIPPRMDRNWAPEYAQLPYAEFNGDLLTIHNVRNFNYSTGTPEEHWETRTYDLSKLTGLDLFYSFWGSPHIAHTILSWQFAEGDPLSISIETRREKTEEYSAIKGFFRQFELYYVVADERDIIKLRTNFRGEEVYLYRLATPLPLAKKILLDYFQVINHLHEVPEWYNAGLHNCTTSIRHHLDHVDPTAKPWTWELFLNGHLPERQYAEGILTNEIPFDELQRVSNISERGKLAGERSDYSQFVREVLPSRPIKRLN